MLCPVTTTALAMEIRTFSHVIYVLVFQGLDFDVHHMLSENEGLKMRADAEKKLEKQRARVVVCYGCRPCTCCQRDVVHMCLYM